MLRTTPRPLLLPRAHHVFVNISKEVEGCARSRAGYHHRRSIYARTTINPSVIIACAPQVRRVCYLSCLSVRVRWFGATTGWWCSLMVRYCCVPLEVGPTAQTRTDTRSHIDIVSQVEGIPFESLGCFKNKADKHKRVFGVKITQRNMTPTVSSCYIICGWFIIVYH